ncbi:MAG: TraB/GumN family protein [Methanosarcinaceae archaeon]|nr:TraB/GumN family protein [Methanosarcinaceae archaeon]
MDSDDNISDSQTQTPEYDLHTTSQSNFIDDIPITESAHPMQMPSHIIIVGTAHVSEKSVAEVIETIEREQPDIVAVELCKGRYDALKGNVGVSKIPIKDLLSEGKVYFFLVHWLLAYVQKKIGDDMGVKPGAEMISAIDAAEAAGAQVALIDRDIQITLQRFWSKMRLIEKLRMGVALIGAALGIGGGKDIDIETITDQDMVTMLIEELRGIAPTAAVVLIDERDAYIAGNLVRAAAGGGKKIVAVVGAGHRSGIEKYLRAPETIPAPRTLMDVPKKRFGIMKFIGIGIVGIALATFAMLILSGTPLKLLLIAFGWWFIINGVFSAAGALLARGHPYSVLTAFFVAWLTSLNPMMAAGWFAGLMEAKKRTPTTDDFKMLVEVESTSDMMNNNLFRVILVAAFANIGSMIGTFLGVYVMMQVAGIDPRDIINAGFAAIGF